MAISPEVLHRYLDEDLSAFGLSPCGTTWPGMSLEQAFASSLKNSLTKKLVSNVDKDADRRALAKFLACNLACGEWRLATEKIDSKLETILGELKRTIYDFWFKDHLTTLCDHPYTLLARARLGPGVNRMASGTDFYAKLFSGKLSCSDPSLYRWYRRYIKRFPCWDGAEDFRESQFGPSSVALSKLSFVPKNDQISRCICIEPTLNTFFQLGFADILESRLASRFGIDLSNQQFKNRDLARLGSITDCLSTIDLSSASDSISMNMLRWLLPADFLSQLVKYRTPAVEIEGVGTVPLNMISTMGNGYTFPLQTMIFAGVVIACMRFRGLNPFSRASSDELWGVNGDDIACPRSCTADVISTLAFLGFSVNDDKSFTEGPFRESCGSDFFNGVDIRGVYLKDTSSRASLYSAINLLVRFSVRSGIPLTRLISFLYKRVKPIFVPRSDGLSDGIHAPSYLSQVRRYRKDKNLQAKAYKFLSPVPIMIRYHDSSIWTPKGYKPRIFNPDGLLISFLQGTINSSTTMVRSDHIRWKEKRRVSSSWDANPMSIRDHFDYGMDWQRWEIAAYILFND